MKITSLTNNKVKELAKLKNKKNRLEEELFIVEGLNMVTEAKKHNVLVETLSMDETLEADHYVTYDVMKKISDTETPPAIIGVCKMKLKNSIGNRIVALENIQDPGNLGAIIRSAAAFGFDVVMENCVDIFSPKVVRSTQGCLFKVGLLATEDITSFLKDNFYKIYSTKVDGGTDVREFTPGTKFALVIGNEGRGVSDKVLNSSDEFLYITMTNDVESLNAAVAASIIMDRLRG